VGFMWKVHFSIGLLLVVAGFANLLTRHCSTVPGSQYRRSGEPLKKTRGKNGGKQTLVIKNQILIHFF